MTSKRKKGGKNNLRDSRIELLRIIACLFVVTLHTKSSSSVNGELIFGRVMFSNLIADGVSIFLLITGFYFFNKSSYFYRLKRLIVKIFIPTFLYILFLLLLPYLQNMPLNLTEIGNSLILCITRWEPYIHNSGHLWYMFVYMLIVLVSPVLQLIHDKLLDNTAGRTVILTATFVMLLANDLTGNMIFHSSQVPLKAFAPACLIVLSGSALYEIRKLYEGKLTLGIAALAIYTGINIWRSVAITGGVITVSDAMFCCQGWVCAVCLCIVFMSFKRSYGTGSRVINAIASVTSGVYILHVWMNETLYELGVKMWIVGFICDGSENFSEYIKFCTIYPVIVFAVCAIVTAVIKWPFKALKKNS